MVKSKMWQIVIAILATLMLAGFAVPARAETLGGGTIAHYPVTKGYWADPKTDGICSGVYQMTSFERKNFSMMGWAHYPEQFKSVLCSGWRGPLDFATLDVSGTQSVGGWVENDPIRYYIRDEIAMINKYWMALNPHGVLFISGMHEANGFWFKYGSCRTSSSANCQMPVTEWASKLRTQYDAFRAGLSPSISARYVLALNFTSYKLVNGSVLKDSPQRWIDAARRYGVPTGTLALSMYQPNISMTWEAFRVWTVKDEVLCQQRGIALSACTLMTAAGPDSWARIAQLQGFALVWREWGALSPAWLAGAKAYLSYCVSTNRMVAEAYLYDASRRAVPLG